MGRKISKWVWRAAGVILLALVGTMDASIPAAAQAVRPQVQVLGDRLELAVGEGTLVRLPRPSLSIFIADPDVADVQVPSPSGIFVMGKKTGTTTLYAVDQNNTVVLRRTVVVRHNIQAIQELLKDRFPTQNFALASAPGSLMISGSADSPEQVNAIAATVTPMLAKDEKLINNIALRRATQVHLRVRIAEVSRDINQQFGVNWQALLNPGNVVAGILNGRDFYDDDKKRYVLPTDSWSILGGYKVGQYNVQAMIDALDAEGLVSVMAEPNLTAVSGQTASFLAGGEFPVPVAQSNTNSISVEFKPFGVALDFTPTVLSNNRISLNVRPEVSEINPANSIVINGLSIPGLTVRRVNTTVELASGQSFAIGGLLQNNMHDAVSKFPGLGDLPVLGKLFSSQNYRNSKSELVVIVTAYVVRPADADAFQTPLQSLKPAGDVEKVVQNRLGIDPLAPSSPRLMGAAGFIY